MHVYSLCGSLLCICAAGFHAKSRAIAAAEGDVVMTQQRPGGFCINGEVRKKLGKIDIKRQGGTRVGGGLCQICQIKVVNRSLVLRSQRETDRQTDRQTQTYHH